MAADALLIDPQDFAHRFRRGLLAPDELPPSDIVAMFGEDVARRYNVHRNNVTVSLIDALTEVYPAVHRITGPDFFRAMARSHIRQTPPTSPLLFEYGRAFPDFIEHYVFAREMPWLADTARIERAWLDAYHAADAQPLGAEAFANYHADALIGLRFSAHPAARLVRSNYPAVAIFTMNRATSDVERLRSSDAEDALITRPATDVIVSRLPPGGAEFLYTLFRGNTLGDAAVAGFEASPAFDLELNFGGIISAGAFSAIHAGE